MTRTIFALGYFLGTLTAVPFAVWYYQGLQDFKAAKKQWEETLDCDAAVQQSERYYEAQLALMKGRLNPWTLENK